MKYPKQVGQLVPGYRGKPFEDEISKKKKKANGYGYPWWLSMMDRICGRSRRGKMVCVRGMNTVCWLLLVRC